MAKLFDLEKAAISIPPSKPDKRAVAAKIAALEGGVAAMLTSSGQPLAFSLSSIFASWRSYRKRYQHLWSTYNLLAVTLKKLESNARS